MPKAPRTHKSKPAASAQIPPSTPRVDRLQEGYRESENASEEPGEAIQRFMECQVQAVMAVLGLRHTEKVLTLLAVDLSRVNSDEPMQRRLIDVAHAVGRAVSVMNCGDIFGWLTEPEVLLGNRLPLNVLRIPNGVREVEASLDAIYVGTLT